MKEATRSTSPEASHLRWIFVIARFLRNKNVCLELFSPSSWSASRVAVSSSIARAKGRPSNWIKEEQQLTVALLISESALPWDCQCLLTPSLSGHQVRLKIQTPPPANPIPPPSQYVHAFLLLSGNTMIAVIKEPLVGQRKACAGSHVQAGQQVGKAHAAFDPFRLYPLGFDAAHAVDLPKCPLAPQCWVRSIVLGLSTCPKCSQPGSWQLSVPGPFIRCCGWVLCPQLRLSDSSGSKVSKFSLGPAHRTYSPSR